MNSLTQYSQLIWTGTLETLYMVGVSLLIAVVFGLPLGIFTVITRRGHIAANLIINKILDAIINIGRSIPFIILMVAIIPFTRKLVGTSIGTTAAIVPLAVAAIPFVGRIVESAMLEISPGVIEAARSMGATPLQIIMKVLLPESLPGLILGITLTAINLIGYSAMAGAIGGGGLGDIAIRYGYQRFRVSIMIATVLVLILLVEIIQWTGNKIAAYYDHK